MLLANICRCKLKTMCCVDRSVVAEAMFNKLLERMKASSSPLQASVESASLGPSFANHDPRVVRLANEAGLRLPPKTPRSFEDIKDSAGYDLILAMDRFDFEEVSVCFASQCNTSAMGTESTGHGITSFISIKKKLHTIQSPKNRCLLRED